MSTIVEVHTTILGKSGVTAKLYPEFSDTVDSTEVVEEATHRKGVYVFTTDHDANNFRVELWASGATVSFWFAFFKANGSEVVADDSYSVAVGAFGGESSTPINPFRS